MAASNTRTDQKDFTVALLFLTTNAPDLSKIDRANNPSRPKKFPTGLSESHFGLIAGGKACVNYFCQALLRCQMTPSRRRACDRRCRVSGGGRGETGRKKENAVTKVPRNGAAAKRRRLIADVRSLVGLKEISSRPAPYSPFDLRLIHAFELKRRHSGHGADHRRRPEAGNPASPRIQLPAVTSRNGGFRDPGGPSIPSPCPWP